MTETGGNTINGIHVTKDGTVHLTGTTYGAKSLGFYWSNSSGTVYTNRVDEGSGSAFDVFVDEENSNIYFTTHEGWTNSDGTQTYQAALWTNMEPKDEPESMSAGDINSQIYSISVDSNGDVYLGGSEGPGLDRRAAYWRIRQRMHRRDVRTGRRDYNHIFRTERGRKHNCQMLHER